jgi:activator of HSP90 ATPase
MPLKVICIFDYVISPLYEGADSGKVKYGNVYTVKAEHRGYSEFAKRDVDAYEFFEMEGLYEKGIFIPIDENKFDTLLSRVLKVPKLKKNKIVCH